MSWRQFRLPESAFLLLGLATVVALAAVRGGDAALTAKIAAGTALYFFVLCAILQKKGVWHERTRLIVTYIFTFWFYGSTSRVTPALGSWTFDSSLLAADQFLFGRTPAVSLERFARPWLTDLLSLCYLSYLVYLQIVVLWALAQPTRVIRRYGPSIFTGFVAGFLSYLLLPALGPGPAFPSLFSTTLHGGALTRLNDAAVSRGAAIYGTFPSLHLLMRLLLLDNDWRECRPRFWIMLTPAIGLVVSTLYLRYHYATDLLAGAGFFLILRWSNRRIQKKTQFRQTSRIHVVQQ